ncbi:5-formyltetrahydrofolate cyclo-ligase [Spiractinospora alimapuensis]|uniref:5-formyltetrahydrofolate cyclo-ligase n=1 Tax=Spiractinospora alimapuensis TaxID=2820884 RepID=UPI001F249BFF|nr:5-formyltetrahydrofolate cyclo-ligase [Spiractinospora alimapuensis]QVQ52666.1 5-formyltetrahydrofolate cyclo-ligase [Spiractinospora alimapuensis]
MEELRTEAKTAVRLETWDALRDAGAARFPGVKGRIPNFVGAERAAERLATLPEWAAARVVKANPDSPQWPVRTRGVAEGKRLFMAVPRLAGDAPFLLLEEDRLHVAPRTATSIKGSAVHATPTPLDTVDRIDLIVCGTVAVDPDGRRVGKGGGFSDLEFGLLTEVGLVDEHTVIATTVHPTQVLEGPLPETEHDFRVDLIVTPEEVIRTPAPKRPAGILRNHLTLEKIEEIPPLRRLLAERDATA